MANISNIKLPNGSTYGFNADTVDNIHIKTTTITAATGSQGNFVLWNVSATQVPIFAYSSNTSNIICRPFIGNNRKSWMLAVDNATTHQPLTNSSSVSYVIYYFIDDN